ncbi:MAG: insulinase family protein [Bacteroidia bacterium]|nr:insulinase family protein [Bacteroidia bacterium]
MVKFERFVLDNGLIVLVNEDKNTPLVAMNILYKVGARDEQEDKTGFAHLFEHLMFGGSVNIPNYDKPLQEAGGENNAFTNNDITNYYMTIPAVNLETGFWLESDRMLNLAFSDKSLDVQRDVVIEEFKQRYLNQPYGDVWLMLRPLAYKVHPYKWPTIGQTPDHISDAKMEDVRSFFTKYYNPTNAIMALSGGITVDRAKELCKKWFAEIPAGQALKRNIPIEPKQTEKRTKTVHRKVPVNMLYLTFHGDSRVDSSYYAMDLLSDVLGNGKSSRLHKSLVLDKKIFTDISAYQTGNIDKGLFVISGKIANGIDSIVAEKEVFNEIQKFVNDGPNENEIEKVRNKIESVHAFGELENANRALNLCFNEMLGDAELTNQVVEKYNKVTAKDIQDKAKEILREENCSALHYLKEE